MLVGGEVAVLVPSRVPRSRSTKGNDAEGRGISRRISTRNLLNIFVAFTFGKFFISAHRSRKILLALCSFEQKMKTAVPNS